MGNWLHRTKQQYLTSISVSKLPEPVANYISEPDMSPVAGIPSKYWKVVGDVVAPMTQAERDAVDAAELAGIRAAEKAQLDELRILKAFALIVLDEINVLRSAAGLQLRTEQQLVSAIKNRVDAI